MSMQRRWAFCVGGTAGLFITALYVLTVREIASLPFDGRIVRAQGLELFAAASYKGVPYLLALVVLPGVAALAFVALMGIGLRRRRCLPPGALTGLVVASYPIVVVGGYAGGYIATTLGSKPLGFATMWLYGGMLGGFVGYAFTSVRSSMAEPRSN